MVYKFLNTIVDDLFAFVITMPWLRRLSCFRDGNYFLLLHFLIILIIKDIIFVIYIYQRWIYRVDKKRTVYIFFKKLQLNIFFFKISNMVF
jgi:hypothetical protein